MIEPLFDRIIVLEDDPETITKGGLIIPEVAVSRVTTGIVKAVGNGLVTESGEIRTLTVQKGDQVMFRLPAGSQVKINGVMHLMLRESEVLGVLESTEANQGGKS